MAADDQARHELFLRLTQVLGHDHATTLMAMLPPSDWANVATRHDLEVLEERLGRRFEAIDGRFEAIDGRFEAIDGRFEAIDGRFEGIDQRFDEFEERMLDRMQAVEQGLLATVRRELNEQTRLLFFSMLGAVFTAASVAFAAGQVG